MLHITANTGSTSSAASIAQFFTGGNQGQIKAGHGFCTTSAKSLAAHEHLFLAGENQTHVYQILEGVICLYDVLADGRRQIATFCYPGDLIGIDSSAQFAHNAESLCDAQVRCIPLKAMDYLITSEPGFSQAMLNVLATELAETRDQLLSLGRKSAKEKVATFLLRISRRNEREGADSTEVYLPMTRAEIADYLGLTIETVSRNITKLKVSGIIRPESRGRIQILDMGKLEAIAEGS